MPRERTWTIDHMRVATEQWGSIMAIRVSHVNDPKTNLLCDSTDARQLAEALVEAADELDPMRLGGTDAA